MEPLHYFYSVSMLSDQHTTLMLGDIFKLVIEVSSYSINTGPRLLLCYSPSQSIPCHNFFQESQGFLWTLLRTLLSHMYSYIESVEEIIEGLISAVRKAFQVDVVASSSPLPSSSLESQQREIPLKLEIILLDNGMYAATEESMQNFTMIPASNEAIQTSLKKCIILTRTECCPICLEDLDVNVECYIMPCHHLFHLQCIVAWLQTSHVCPLCRYPLPTHLEN